MKIVLMILATALSMNLIASECKLVRSSGYYYVEIDGDYMTSRLDYSEAIEAIHQFNDYGMCELPTAYKECTVERYSGKYYINKGGNYIAAPVSKLSEIERWTKRLERDGICLRPTPKNVCQLERFSGKYYINVGSNYMTAGMSSLKQSINKINELNRLGLCYKPSVQSRCEVQRSSGNFYVVIDGKYMTQPHREIQDAMKEVEIMTKANLCTHKSFNSSAPTHDPIHFRWSALKMSRNIIDIITNLEPYSSTEDYTEILLPIKKQAARLSARIEGRAEFKRVRNTLIHLEVLLEESEPYIEETFEKGALFEQSRQLLRERELVRSLVRLMDDHGDNTGNVLY